MSAFPLCTDAMMSPHPIQLYEKGYALLNRYSGDPSKLYEAQEVFGLLIEKYPDSPFGYLGMSRIHTIDAYLYGNHYNMDKIRTLALPFAVKALELGSSIRPVHENYANFERIFDQYAINREQAQDSLTLFPDSPKTYFGVATFLSNQGEHEKALGYYNTALELDPSESLRLRILKRMALIYLQEYQEPEKAVDYYHKALGIRENSPVLNEYLGIAYLKMQLYELSIEKLSKALALVKISSPEHYLLEAKGYLSEKQGKVEEAINFLEKASAYKKHNSTLQYSLGNLYYKQANYERAYDHFRRVIDLKPLDPNAYYFAGRSADSLGDMDLARDYYKKYLQFDTDSQEAHWIQENIPEFSKP